MIKIEFDPEGHKVDEGEILEGDWSDDAPGVDGDEGVDYEELTGSVAHLDRSGLLKESLRAGPSSLSPKVITLKLPNPDQRPPAVISVQSTNKRIPRPPNAFMLYANTWRRKLANIYPGESNKEISVRLGKLWKSMGQAEKESYFNLAKQVDAEHKMRYPDYVYNPKEARLRKALRDQGRLHRPRQKWKPSSSAIRQSSLSPMMLKQARAEDYRSHTMLQNYNDSFPDLNYPQVHMPPPGDYNLVQPLEQSWYNSYVHGGLQNGGGDFYGRVNDNKSDWNSYSDQESPYVSSQINNNNSEGSPYSSMQSVPQMMGQQMQMEGQMMINNQDQMIGSAPDPLLISDVHNEMLPNGVESAPVEPTTPIPTKDEDSLPKLDGPQATLVNSEGPAKEGGKDSLKLPGFHQTFGNITEIGRFSQHDDYFESRPAEVISQPPKDLPTSDDDSNQGYFLPVTNDGVVSYMWQGMEPSVYIASPDGPITFYSQTQDSTYYTMEVTNDGDVGLPVSDKDLESTDKEAYLETLSSISEDFKLQDIKVPGSFDLEGGSVILSGNENVCMVLKTEDGKEQRLE